MSFETFLLAFALMMIFEGMLPFISPKNWRDIFSKVVALEDKQIRFMGLIMMGVGVVSLMIMGA